MRKTRFGLVLMLATLAGQEARAQFANRRMGFELGGFTFNDREVVAGLGVHLEGSFYVENGFDLGARVGANLLLTRLSNVQLFGADGQLYFRYLFSEESLRPYAGAAIDVLGVVRGSDPTDPSSGNQQVFFGPQAFVGIDYFPTEQISIGARGFFTVFFAVNNTNAVRPGGGGYLSMHFYF
jgi:outer membrane protein